MYIYSNIYLYDIACMFMYICVLASPFLHSCVYQMYMNDAMLPIYIPHLYIFLYDILYLFVPPGQKPNV